MSVLIELGVSLVPKCHFTFTAVKALSGDFSFPSTSSGNEKSPLKARFCLLLNGGEAVLGYEN